MPDQAASATDHPQTILLVDDEPLNLDLLEQELEELDLEIRTASDGREAIERVSERAPDMIFLDLMMPVMDGFQVLEQLQADPDWRHIPVVIVSAMSDMDSIVKGIEMGAVDFLPKPFEPEILHARLNAGLERKRLHDLEHAYLKSLERELEIGREIQAGFLPSEIPQPDGWALKAFFKPAREVAGDFYDVFEMEHGNLGLLVGDVTDKGVGSALYMALIRSLLRATVMADSFTGEGKPEGSAPSEERVRQAVTLANKYLCQVHDSALYATLFFGVLETRSGKLCYLNAGHDPPLVVRDSDTLSEIRPTGPAVGIFEGAAYQIETLILQPGESLVLYSDGVTDAQNPAGEAFGPERFRALLQQPDLDGFPSHAALLAALDKHLDTAAQYDDITLLIVSRE